MTKQTKTVQRLITQARRVQERFPQLPPLKFVQNDLQLRGWPWMAKAKGLLASRRYDEIEKVVVQLTQDQSEGADGNWDIFNFGEGLQIPSVSQKDADSNWRANHAQIVAWNVARPRSALAQLMLAQSWWNGAGVARGEGRQIVSYEKMEQRLSKAAPLFAKLGSVRERSPLHYYYRLGSAHLIPVERSQYEALFRQAQKAYPTCSAFYFRKAYYLLPRWNGELGEWEQFAEESAAKLQGEAGDILYARIVWSQLSIFKESNVDIWQVSKISWPRTRSAFKVLLKRWPDSLSAATNLFLLATSLDPMADATANDLLQNYIGGKVDKDFWGNSGAIGLFGYNRMMVIQNIVNFGPSPNDEAEIAPPAK